MDLKMFAAIRPGTPEYPPTNRKELASWYNNQPHNPKDKDVVKSYDLLIFELCEQYKNIYHKSWTMFCYLSAIDPYATSDEMFASIRGGIVEVYATPLDAMPADHPMMGWTDLVDSRGVQMRVNDVFRAVHDYVHWIGECTFAWTGELQASRIHAAMMAHPLARRALMVETICQNAAYYESSVITEERKFAEQKACIATDAMVARWYGITE